MKYHTPLILQLVKLSQALVELQAPLLSSSTPDLHNVPSNLNAVNNAPDIFNTIHGAMRQWDNSLKHNGMSIYPVTVAENTIFYHGGISNKPINKTEWLAFEVEHAEAFINIFPLSGGNGSLRYAGHVDESNNTGYLSTYRTTRPLNNVIYFDGMSAAKSKYGTLDIQDRVLLQNNDFKSYPGFEDFNRVHEICKLLPQVDGIIRMELGFELIICDTSNKLELLSITSHPQHFYRNKTENVFWRSEYMRGVSIRYKGLVSGKISIDFSSMISAFFYPFNLTNPNLKKAELPRIHPEEKEKITRLRNDVVTLFNNQSRPQVFIRWQSIVDELVTRYSDRLAYMESKKSNRLEMIHETKFLLERFINRAELNLTASKEQCASLYLLPAMMAPMVTMSDIFIYEAVITVSREICNSLFEVREKLLSRHDAAMVVEAKLMVKDLMKWLNWSTWKECGKCDWDEVCFVAIWPWGTQEDHDHPSCRKIDQWWPSLDYWDENFGDGNVEDQKMIPTNRHMLV
ncbi:hypothetical protein HI914_03992 [Erysiphe necator]|nr:hypothetical protein HI914_03992 [Erysiphe necator]